LKRAALAVADEVRATGAGEVVVGLPIRGDGTEGESARRARDFARRVEEIASVPVVLWDERLTTVAAERSLTEAGVRGRKRKKVVDQAAATLILQGYLDSIGEKRRDYALDDAHLPLPKGAPWRRRKRRR
jgi:putative Holliday junction resolvase